MKLCIRFLWAWMNHFVEWALCKTNYLQCNMLFLERYNYTQSPKTQEREVNSDTKSRIEPLLTRRPSCILQACEISCEGDEKKKKNGRVGGTNHQHTSESSLATPGLVRWERIICLFLFLLLFKKKKKLNKRCFLDPYSYPISISQPRSNDGWQR